MLFEHLIYSTAIAIIAGMLWFKRTGRDPSWIIITSAYAPDIDIVAGELIKKLDLNILTTPIRHGDFHNIAFLLLFATATGLVLRLAGMRLRDSFLFANIGGGAHVRGCADREPSISILLADNKAEVGDRVEQVYS